MFIQTEETPNPATIKFIPGKPVLKSGMLDYKKAEDAKNSPLAKSLFGIPGVDGIFLSTDFISVTRDKATDWAGIKPAIMGTIMEHYMSDLPVVDGEEVPEQMANEVFDEKDADLVKEIKKLIDTRVRPAVAQDGGDIIFRGFKDGIVMLEMRGACSGCPSSTATLKNGVEKMLKHYVPSVKEVQQTMG